MDFIPGYVNVITSSTFTPSKFKIWVIGKENGKIYYQCNSKEELNSYINSTYSSIPKMICYSKSISFNDKEMNDFWNLNYWPIDGKGIKKIKESFSQTMKFIY